MYETHEQQNALRITLKINTMVLLTSSSNSVKPCSYLNFKINDTTDPQKDLFNGTHRRQL